MTNAIHTDLYARVTNRIIDDLAKGVRPWLKPWTEGKASGQSALPRRHNGTPYKGVNILLLWGAALDSGFASTTWMTYRQAAELGSQVRKGERGSLVVYADRVIRTEQGEAGEEVERSIPFLKGYTVFNADQVDRLPASYYVASAPEGLPCGPLPTAEAFFARSGARFLHGGDRAFYSPARDCIQLPPVAAFRDAESYAATKAHELIHWTGHGERCAREFGKRFGDTAYAREELVAELGAAFLCSSLALTPEPREDHAAYLGHWLSVLKADKRAIFSAASHAQRAADYLHDLQSVDFVATNELSVSCP